MEPGAAAYALAALAGVLTLLNPCVLPLIPAIAAGAANRHRLGLPALGLGLAAAFTTAGVALAGGGQILGLAEGQWRLAGGAAMVVFGAMLISTRLRSTFARLAAPAETAGHELAGRFDGGHPLSQAAVGAMLGLAWTPCVGPTLGAAMGLAATGEHLAEVALIMLVFSVAAVAPLLAISAGAQHWLTTRGRLARWAGRANRVMGVTLIIIGALIATGLEKPIEAWLLDAAPDWWVRITTRI